MEGHEGYKGSPLVIANPYFGVLEFWSIGVLERAKS
jgi:hypothetical protein